MEHPGVNQVRPLFTTDNCPEYHGTTVYLTFGDISPEWIRLRIRIPANSTREESAAIIRKAADQIERGEGSEIRIGETLFLD